MASPTSKPKKDKKKKTDKKHKAATLNNRRRMMRRETLSQIRADPLKIDLTKVIPLHPNLVASGTKISEKRAPSPRDKNSPRLKHKESEKNSPRDKNSPRTKHRELEREKHKESGRSSPRGLGRDSPRLLVDKKRDSQSPRRSRESPRNVDSKSRDSDSKNYEKSSECKNGENLVVSLDTKRIDTRRLRDDKKRQSDPKRRVSDSSTVSLRHSELTRLELENMAKSRASDSDVSRDSDNSRVSVGTSDSEGIQKYRSASRRAFESSPNLSPSYLSDDDEWHLKDIKEQEEGSRDSDKSKKDKRHKSSSRMKSREPDGKSDGKERGESEERGRGVNERSESIREKKSFSSSSSASPRPSLPSTSPCTPSCTPSSTPPCRSRQPHTSPSTLPPFPLSLSITSPSSTTVSIPLASNSRSRSHSSSSSTGPCRLNDKKINANLKRQMHDINRMKKKHEKEKVTLKQTMDVNISACKNKVFNQIHVVMEKKAKNVFEDTKEAQLQKRELKAKCAELLWSLKETQYQIKALLFNDEEDEEENENNEEDREDEIKRLKEIENRDYEEYTKALEDLGKLAIKRQKYSNEVNTETLKSWHSIQTPILIQIQQEIELEHFTRLHALLFSQQDEMAKLLLSQLDEHFSLLKRHHLKSIKHTMVDDPDNLEKISEHKRILEDLESQESRALSDMARSQQKDNERLARDLKTKELELLEEQVKMQRLLKLQQEIEELTLQKNQKIRINEIRNKYRRKLLDLNLSLEKELPDTPNRWEMQGKKITNYLKQISATIDPLSAEIHELRGEVTPKIYDTWIMSSPPPLLEGVPVHKELKTRHSVLSEIPKSPLKTSPKKFEVTVSPQREKDTEKKAKRKSAKSTTDVRERESRENKSSLRRAYSNPVPTYHIEYIEGEGEKEKEKEKLENVENEKDREEKGAEI
eukprot:TRINITY_DN3553_c0_g1_i1.p2 TRINITY_DN3553_c0_g1~~TRINITY_DN3553_c0_g1_i1.p2  ORF type:complete len:927 (-),score=231.00 TRINITY_DN3553_c0_g1_i1:73-2853(-)